MIRVKNRRAVANLSAKSLKANRTRNAIAVAAIALTSLLFTALFTVLLSMMDNFEYQTFRQVGGDMHGTFKDITEQQMLELQADPLIVQPAARLQLGMLGGDPFRKIHAEISYMDEACAKGYFCMPTQGALPAEGADEIACDTRILSLLGVEPELGAEITLSYELGSGTGQQRTVTGTFTLSGWWEYDPACTASMALVPRSYAEAVLADYPVGQFGDTTGTWALNVYLKSAAHIAQDLQTILANHGYQNTDSSAANYIGTGVNWAYLGAQASQADAAQLAGVAVLLAIVVLTGYLIIYNIFQISVTGNIRFYGLLKTIGATGRQLRSVVLRQALALSALGIPVGLALGYLTGAALAPAAIDRKSVV